MNKKFYVVWKGAKTGIFATWAEVQQHTNGRSDAQFMAFPTKMITLSKHLRQLILRHS